MYSVREVKKILGENKITDKEFFELKSKLFDLKAKSNKKEYSEDEAEMMKYAKILLELGFSPFEASTIVKSKWNNKAELIDFVLTEIEKKEESLKELKARIQAIKEITNERNETIFPKNLLNQILLTFDDSKIMKDKLENELKVLGKKIENASSENKTKMENSIKNLFLSIRKLNEISEEYDTTLVKNTLYYFEKEIDSLLKIKTKRYMLCAGGILGSFKELRDIFNEEFNSGTSEYLANAIMMNYSLELNEKIKNIIEKYREEMIDKNEHNNNMIIKKHAEELVKIASDYYICFDSVDALGYFENVSKTYIIKKNDMSKEDIEMQKNINMCVKILKIYNKFLKEDKPV